MMRCQSQGFASCGESGTARAACCPFFPGSLFAERILVNVYNKRKIEVTTLIIRNFCVVAHVEGIGSEANAVRLVGLIISIEG
jgi:hypothetical protein